VKPSGRKTDHGLRKSSAPVKDGASTTASRAGKVRKEFWLDPKLLRAAKKHLGAANEREAVEMALTLVSFRKELQASARTLRSLRLSRID
jgi:hypothetical protein